LVVVEAAWAGMEDPAEASRPVNNVVSPENAVAGLNLLVVTAELVLDLGAEMEIPASTTRRLERHGME
jgi:hypothetical protein